MDNALIRERAKGPQKNKLSLHEKDLTKYCMAFQLKENQTAIWVGGMRKTWWCCMKKINKLMQGFTSKKSKELHMCFPDKIVNQNFIQPSETWKGKEYES